MPQIVELLIVLGATKELSKDMAGCPVNHIPQSTGLPLSKVISNPMEWHQKVMNPCIMKYPPIRSTSHPATEDVAKMHVECCGSQDILGDPTFPVAIAGPG